MKQNESLSRLTGWTLAVASCVLVSGSAQAATVAYYRFEEGPDNGFLTAVLGGPTLSLTLDSSGNNNHMRTFNAPATPEANFDTSPRYNTSVPGATVPQTGASNDFSFRFGQIDGFNDDIYLNASGSLNQTFDNVSTFTIEAFINTNNPDAFRTFIGRDDFADEAPGPIGLAYFQTRAVSGGVLAFAAQDKSNTTREIVGPNLVANTWYHVAVVGDGTNATLYLDGASVGSVGFDGFFNSPGEQGWTIGRGFFNGPNDFWDGGIDEVRFSDTALSPSQFLNVVPEPASLGLLGLAGLFALRRRR